MSKIPETPAVSAALPKASESSLGSVSGKTIGIGVGIGSAAIVAALLFVNRGKAK